MKYERAKFCKMLANYAEEEIVPKITSGNSGVISDATAKILATAAIALFKRNEGFQNKLLNRFPILDCLFDEDGKIDADDVLDALSDAMDQYQDFEVTILNQKFRFKPSDLKTLKKYLNWSEKKDA